MLSKSKIITFLASTTFVVSLSLVPNKANAQLSWSEPYELPTACELGNHTAYDPSIGATASFLWDAATVFLSDVSNPANLFDFTKSTIGMIFGFDSLKIRAPKHILQGKTFTARAEAFAFFEDIRFYNSELGYVMYDRTNIEGDAQEPMSFPKTHGYGLVWAEKDDECSATGVWVQKSPTISGSAYYSNGLIRANMSFSVDEFSKASLDHSTKSRVSLIIRDDLYLANSSTSTFVSSDSGNISLALSPHAGRGNYRVQAVIHDGTYTKTYTIGEVFVNSGFPTNPCGGCVPR